MAIAEIFLPFLRRDDDARTVTGFCYTMAKVPGDKWNLKRDSLERAGARYMEMPCIRAMHQPIAAGKALSLLWTPAGCELTAHIVDDNEWKKVQEGVYRGFSIGGRPIIARGNDIEEFDWHETSLVDRPKDSGARFKSSVARVDGAPDDAELEAAPVLELPEDAPDDAVDAARVELATAHRVEGVDEETGSEGLPFTARGITSVTAPTRENLEGDTVKQPPAADTAPAIGEALNQFAAAVMEAATDPDSHARILKAIAKAQAALGSDADSDETPHLGQLRVEEVELTRMAELTRAELATAQGEVNRLEGDVTRLSGDVTRLETELQSAREEVSAERLQREERESTLQRVEGELQRAEGELTRVRALPTPRRPVQYPEAVERSFAANDLLPGGANGTGTAGLQQRLKELETRAVSEKDPDARRALATQMLGLQQQINHQ